MEEFEDNLLNHVDPVQRRQLRVMYHITCKLKCPLRVGGGDQVFPKNNSNFLNLHRKFPNPHPADTGIIQTSPTERKYGS